MMLTSPDEKSVILFGGKNIGVYKYKTPWNGPEPGLYDFNPEFKIVAYLKFERRYPVGFFVPNELTKCGKLSPWFILSFSSTTFLKNI